MSDEKNSSSNDTTPKDRPRPIETVWTSSLDKKQRQPFPKGEKR